VYFRHCGLQSGAAIQATRKKYQPKNQRLGCYRSFRATMARYNNTYELGKREIKKVPKPILFGTPKNGEKSPSKSFSAFQGFFGKTRQLSARMPLYALRARP
jgi:hypothetical protein